MRKRVSGLAVLFIVLGFGLVGIRLLYMQVFHNSFYVQQATELQTRDSFITPNRGTIYDANMQVLAESASVERICITPSAVVDETKVNKGISAESQQQTLATILSDTLDLDYDTVLAKIQKTDSMYEIIAQKVDKDVAKELYAALEAADCQGVYSETDTKRYYQQGAFLSAVLGYVDSDNNGVYGIEAEYNDELSGTAGRIVRVQNAKNIDVEPEASTEIPAQDGNSLVLTIDSDIQNVLEKHLETALADNPNARDGVSGIVMNVKTGEVLAMANLPDFDPNNAYQLTSERYINELKEDAAKILEDAGAAAIAVHGRTREQFYSGRADWEIIRRVKEAVSWRTQVFPLPFPIHGIRKAGWPTSRRASRITMRWSMRLARRVLIFYIKRGITRLFRATTNLARRIN